MAATALVTGASSGIGRELARLAARDRHDVVLVARRRERLDELARELTSRWGVRAEMCVADLSEPGAAERVARDAEERLGAVEVLVNAAGLGVHGNFHEVPIERQRETIVVNVLALTELTRACVGGMVERRRGRIVNVASTAAFQPGPLMAVYYATKSYVLSFTEALAEELTDTGVTATAVCPGPTLTEFQQRAGLGNVPLLKGPLLLEVKKVAERGWEGAKAGKRVVIPGLANRILAVGARLSPSRVSTRIARKLQEKRSLEVR